MASDAGTTPPVPARIGAWEIERELGRGAMSVVYRASRGGQTCALKVMADIPVSPGIDLRVMFRREAAAVARLSHPALVRVLESGEHEGRPFLAMELAEGETLASLLQRRRLSDEEVARLGRAVASGLAEVHRHGLIHRDVKPANIVVSPHGDCRLIDFGTVTDGLRRDGVAGTLSYAAPEQLGMLKRAVGPASDLYALGATMYECLVGVPPFVAGPDGDLLHQIAAVPAPDLLQVRETTRPALAAIVARLLRKDPDDRYQSAAGLASDLEDLARLDETIRAGARLALRVDRAAVVGAQVPLIGRGAPLAELAAAWERAQQGNLTFAEITGEGGSGKTRLASEAAARSASGGAVLLWGKCQQHDHTPFGPLREALERYAAAIAQLDAAGRAEAVGHLRRAAGEGGPLVQRLAPALEPLLRATNELRTLEPGAEQQRFYDAMAGFLAQLGTAERPMVLLIDDLQWLDEGTLQVLSALSRWTDAAHVLVIGTSRPGDHAPLQQYRAAVAARQAASIALKPLDQTAVAGILRGLLGGRPVDEATVTRLTTLTRGNPYAVSEYVRTLLDRGVLHAGPQGWTVDPAAWDAVALPSDVVHLLVLRLDELDRPLAELAERAAVLGGRFQGELLARVCGRPPGVIEEQLGQLERDGIVERTFDGGWAFHHDRVREAVEARLSEDARRDAHQAIAEVLDANSTGVSKYAVAWHYGRGHRDRNPARVAETNLVGGLSALEEHAYEEAHGMLRLALDVSEQLGTTMSLGLPLVEGLGRACAMTGRLDEAYRYLDAALTFATTRDDRFRIHYLRTLTFASQGRNDEALASLFESFEVLGRPYPQTAVVQAVLLLSTWVMALVLRWTGFRAGSARGEDRDRRRVLSQLHYAGTMIAMFQGRAFLMVQFVVRDFHNVHYLGAAAETAIASAVYGAVAGTFRLGGVMRHYTQLGVTMAEQLGDRAALAVCRAYQAVGHKWDGELDRGNQMLVDALPALNRDTPGSWYAAMMMCEQAYSYLHAGRTGAAIDHVRDHVEHLQRTNNQMFLYNTLSVEYAERMLRGEVAEATRLWSALEPQYERMSGTAYVRLARSVALLEVLVDREETGPQIEEAIAIFADLKGSDYYSNEARMLIGYARLHQLEHAGPSEVARARRDLWWAMWDLYLMAMVPIFRCHVYIFAAALARSDGKLRRAERMLDKARGLVGRARNPRGEFYLWRERALLAEAAHEPTVQFFAGKAEEVAASEGWRQRQARVRARFQLGERAVSRPRSDATVIAHHAGQAQRYADALLQVSLASASTLDDDSQAAQALDAVARVLGAERAMFFLLDEQGQPVLRASTGIDANVISTTVIRRVLETGEPVCLTGDENGEALGSESIVAHGLRSVLAAPMRLRDEILGVVYLDNRLAKGMFAPEDVDLLRGVANHIAIAVATARHARLEAARSAMARDYDLIGAVQSLILPGSPTFRGDRVDGAGVHQPATRCGGDWWWHERLADGSIRLWMGDVSGHGPGPAMITSAVAGAFHTLRAITPDASVPAVLHELHHRVASFGGGFHMSMTVVHVTEAGIDGWWAGGPPVFIQHGDAVRTLSAPGTLLGQPGRFDVGHLGSSLTLGDRVLLCTDGLLELRRDGRDLGARGVSRLLRKVAALPMGEASSALAREVQDALRGHAQEDDITFVLAELRQPTEAGATQVHRLAMGNQ